MAALAALLASAGASAAVAAPVAVQVRIEGKTETLFEGPVLTEGHDIKASSESQAHPCDGINPNDPQNVTPGPTPTASAVDAMSIIGESFDGRWESSFEDYLITGWGPEREAEGSSWSVFANNTFLEVGGCQYELHPEAQVLWSYGTSASRPLLALLPAGASATPFALTATAKLNAPFTVEVLAYKGKSGTPPPLPERAGSSTDAGAKVAPVLTAVNGFEKPVAESPETVTTNAEGKASITFSTSGWHRIKAIAAGAVRSNRLDVCVPAEGAAGCGPPPAEDDPRAAPGEGGEQTPAGTSTEGPGASSGRSPAGGGSSSGGVPGASANGSRELHIDGLTLTPLGIRSSALHFHGHWRRRREQRAWQGAIMLGSRGATLTVTLAPGRPVLILRDVSEAALLEMRSDGHSGTFKLKAGGDATRLLIGKARARRCAVTLRIVRGAVGLDAVALTPP